MSSGHVLQPGANAVGADVTAGVLAPPGKRPFWPHHLLRLRTPASIVVLNMKAVKVGRPQQSEAGAGKTHKELSNLLCTGPCVCMCVCVCVSGSDGLYFLTWRLFMTSVILVCGRVPVVSHCLPPLMLHNSSLTGPTGLKINKKLLFSRQETGIRTRAGVGARCRTLGLEF